MVSDLRDMREHEEQLMRWLGQKERMLDVLGPVAMEPAMLASQLEQVKVRSRTCALRIFKSPAPIQSLHLYAKSLP